MASPHLGHEAIDRDHLAAGKLSLQGDDVVELEELSLGHRHPELERRRVLGPMTRPTIADGLTFSREYGRGPMRRQDTPSVTVARQRPL